jgi:hypothetical protein
VPLPMVAEDIGWTPQRVSQLRSEMASEMFLAAAQSPAGAQQAPGGRLRLSGRAKDSGADRTGRPAGSRDADGDGVVGEWRG